MRLGNVKGIALVSVNVPLVGLPFLLAATKFKTVPVSDAGRTVPAYTLYTRPLVMSGKNRGYRSQYVGL